MRNQLVYQAQRQVTCHFQLCALAAKIARKFHRPAQLRVAETINNSFNWIAVGPCCHVAPTPSANLRASFEDTKDTEECRA